MSSLTRRFRTPSSHGALWKTRPTSNPMNPLRQLRTFFRKASLDAEMSEEMRVHLELLAAENERRGLSPEEARYAARRQFGGLEQIKERAREERTIGWLDASIRDVRCAFRQLAGSPGFSFLAILTLGLGIGANTAMFSVLNGILLKPLPYPDTAQLDRLYRVTAQNRDGHFAPADFLDLRHAQGSVGDVAAYTAANASLSEPGRPADMAYASRNTVNLLSLLGIRPQLGRDFLPDEETPGRDRVVILSQRVWRNRYGGKPDIIGRSIRIDGEPHKVIGVMPVTFNDWRHLGMIDFFRPLAFTPAQAADRSGTMLRVLLRRSPARSPVEVAGFIANFGARQAANFPEVNAETSWRAESLQGSTISKSAAPTISMMIVLSALVLLIACSNLANLLLARTMARAREFAVRGALGASRLQLLRPLITESLLLALAGGVCAVIVALWFRDYMALHSTGDNGEQVVFDLGWRVFGWAFGASLVTAVAFGIAPALFALRLDLNQTLKSGGRGTTGGRGHQRFRQILIVGQFAVAMILLAAAGVYIRGLRELNNRRAGWESDHLITGTILLPTATYSDGEKITAYHRLALERLGALPGVATVSLSTFTPFFNWADARKFVVDGRERPPAGHEPAALVNSVSPGYFDAYGTRVLAGRAFTAHDTANAPRVFLVSELTARALFGRENPLGQRIAPVDGANPPGWGEVVGVVADVQSAIADSNPNAAIASQVYQPMAQEPRPKNEIAVRTAGLAPTVLVDRIRTTLAALDPDLPVSKLQHADLTIERANYQTAVGRDVFTGMALLGLALASLGIYGIIARTMAQRASEFAIRLALGATLGNITRIVLTSGVKLALVGSALGLLGAIGVCRLIAASNPTMHMNSALVLVSTTLLLIGVALLACWIPARRAGQVDAMSLLRAE